MSAGGFFKVGIMKLPARFHLAHLPTPLEPLDRLSAALGGPRLWIKRDDQTGLAGGGNKTRKLELLIADALAQRADLVLTVGAVQSNHCRQTAAAAARAGLGCVLILRGAALPRGQWTGNLLLDDLLGARIVWTDDRDRNALAGGHKTGPAQHVTRGTMEKAAMPAAPLRNVRRDVSFIRSLLSTLRFPVYFSISKSRPSYFSGGT